MVPDTSAIPRVALMRQLVRTIGQRVTAVRPRYAADDKAREAVDEIISIIEEAEKAPLGFIADSQPDNQKQDNRTIILSPGFGDDDEDDADSLLTRARRGAMRRDRR